MLGQIFGSLGKFIGEHFGGGAISSIFRIVGIKLGNYIEQSLASDIEYYRYKKHLDKLHIEINSEGAEIARVFGHGLVEGRIIWASAIKEIMNDDMRYGLSSNVTTHNISYNYYIDIAFGICQGEISSVKRIFKASEILDSSKYKYRIYRGTEDQLPDILLSKIYGAKTPAFRGLAYIIFEDMPLKEFGNKVPYLRFEVESKLQSEALVTELVQNMVLIPGSGEFVYDTITQTKCSISTGSETGKSYINMNNDQDIADSLYNLNDLQKTYRNLKWVAPVVCWFGDSLNAGICNILPKVEFHDQSSKISEEWSVAGITRDKAQQVTVDKFNSPIYGGTACDTSFVRYLKELRMRGLKIMLYPMLLMDMSDKPWRGHLSGSCEDIPSFFNKDNGYNNFILHYANLAKDMIDAFVIGSEFVSLTKMRTKDNVFPAVDELVRLAIRVKAILGNETLVTYAADWSEYHHTDGGFYNMDKLWASSAIDFIAIDAYFPLTDNICSNISKNDIIDGLSGKEGWDFYIENGDKKPLAPQYAWKNIGYWWSNKHINPDGTESLWQPKSKKIWFTEFGFPSLDKATNQPNIFYNPESMDGGLPAHSNGYVDFATQRVAIKETIEYFKKQEFIEKMFLWAYDIRPYPTWPHFNIWKDSILWSKGHWVNNKLEHITVGSILKNLAKIAGIAEDHIEIIGLDDDVRGFVINKYMSILDAIYALKKLYLFEIVINSNGHIRFMQRQKTSFKRVKFQELIKRDDKEGFVRRYKNNKDNLPSSVLIAFIDECSYERKIFYFNSEYESNMESLHLDAQIVTSMSVAMKIANDVMQYLRIEDGICNFILPMSYIYLQPADIIEIEYFDEVIAVKISTLEIRKLAMTITGVILMNKNDINII